MTLPNETADTGAETSQDNGENISPFLHPDHLIDETDGTGGATDNSAGDDLETADDGKPKKKGAGKKKGKEKTEAEKEAEEGNNDVVDETPEEEGEGEETDGEKDKDGEDETADGDAEEGEDYSETEFVVKVGDEEKKVKGAELIESFLETEAHEKRKTEFQAEMATERETTKKFQTALEQGMLKIQSVHPHTEMPNPESFDDAAKYQEAMQAWSANEQLNANAWAIMEKIDTERKQQVVKDTIAVIPEWADREVADKEIDAGVAVVRKIPGIQGTAEEIKASLQTTDGYLVLKHLLKLEGETAKVKATKQKLRSAIPTKKSLGSKKPATKESPDQMTRKRILAKQAKGLPLTDNESLFLFRPALES